MSAVLDRVTAALADRAGRAGDPVAVVGESVVYVETTHPDHGRLAGVAHRPDGTVPADLGGLSVPSLAGLATGGETHLERAVGLATLNALSVPDVAWRVGDPMATLSAGVETIATVGLFQPAFRKFDALEVRVVERDRPATVESPDGVTVDLFDPGDCRAAFAGVDLCFVTGSTLIYGGLDRYLSVLADLGVDPVVLIGATASHLPGPAFEAGVDVVAGARVTDPDRVREAADEGCGTDLHDRGTEKVYVADGPIEELDLDGTS